MSFRMVDQMGQGFGAAVGIMSFSSIVLIVLLIIIIVVILLTYSKGNERLLKIENEVEEVRKTVEEIKRNLEEI